VLTTSALVSALRDVANTAAPNLLITVSRRYTAAANRAIGYFINRLLLSLTIPTGSAFSDIASLTQAELLAALKNSKIPYQYVAEQLLPNRVDDILGTPSILLTQFRHPKPPDLPGAKAEFFWVDADLDASHYDRLSIELVEGGPDGGLEFISRYNASVYEPAMIEALMANIAERIRPQRSWVSNRTEG
jgi:nonribosomal peptide synthetase protein BlmIV